MKAYFRGSLVTILELDSRYAWVQFPDSDNRRRVQRWELDFVTVS